MSRRKQRDVGEVDFSAVSPQRRSMRRRSIRVLSIFLGCIVLNAVVRHYSLSPVESVFAGVVLVVILMGLERFQL